MTRFNSVSTAMLSSVTYPRLVIKYWFVDKSLDGFFHIGAKLFYATFAYRLMLMDIKRKTNTKETVVFGRPCKQTRAMKDNGGQEKQNQTDKHSSKIVLGPVFSA